MPKLTLITSRFQDISPKEQEADALWLEYCDAALVAQQTLDREDAYKAGRAWARFLDAFAVVK